MFELLLDLIVEKKIYVEISGVTLAGTELTLSKSKDHPYVYIQKGAIFSSMMVKELKFGDRGCIITLKS